MYRYEFNFNFGYNTIRWDDVREDEAFRGSVCIIYNLHNWLKA